MPIHECQQVEWTQYDLETINNNYNIMKLKTRKWISKRTKITGSGKIKCKKAWTNHLLSNKSKKAKNKFKYWKIIAIKTM